VDHGTRYVVSARRDLVQYDSCDMFGFATVVSWFLSKPEKDYVTDLFLRVLSKHPRNAV
jgi:hypothetical protein